MVGWAAPWHACRYGCGCPRQRWNRGLPAAAVPAFWLAASALTELLEGRATLEALRGRGGVLVEGDEAGRRVALDVLGSLAPARRGLVTA